MKILHRGDLGGGMPQHSSPGHHRVPGYAGCLPGDFNLDAGGFGIEGVLQELFDHRGWSVYHLSCCYLLGYYRIENFDTHIYNLL